MNIKKKSKGTPEQMLQASENKINELEGNASIESSVDVLGTNNDDNIGRWAQIDLNAEDEYKYSGNLGRSWVSVDSDAIDIWPSKEAAIENGKSSFKRNYKYGRDWDVVNIDDVADIESATQIDETDDHINADIQDSFQIGDAVMRIDDSEPGEIIDEDIEADEYLVAFDNGEEEWIHMTDLQLVDDDIIESATTITSADAAIDKDYLEKLCEHVTADLDDAGYEAVARVEGEYIVIESMYDADSRYVQPIDDIEPNWDDLNDDAAELADAYMDEYPDSEGYTSFQAWYNKNYATDMTQMDYFLDRAEDLAMYYDEDELPLEKVPEIAKRWAEIAKEKSWSGAWNYPGLWHNYSDDLNDIREDLYDELERDGYPDCYFRQAAEEVLGHRLS